MDDSTFHKNTDDDIDDNFHLFNNQPQIPLPDLMYQSFLYGAEKLLMSRKLFDFTNFESFTDYEVIPPDFERKHASKQNRKVPGRYMNYLLSCNENANVSKIIENYNSFPLNIIASIAVTVLKLASFQLGLFLNLFTFPLRVLNFWLMFLLFPFQTLARIRDQFKKSLQKVINALGSMIMSFICNRLQSHRNMIRMGIRFGRVFFCAMYVFFMLVGMLITGFAVGSFMMRSVVEEPIHRSEVLNFDYTKASPAAIVPVSSSFGTGVASESSGLRAIPANRKMQLTVSLTLPESGYNRNLGIFQVRVESLSANGKVIAAASYPTMLRFKSQPVRVIETLYKSVPLITGLQSEVQNLDIVIKDLTEGDEPTASFKVILEQRAEFQAGSGAPEIYAATLDISSELPHLKRMIYKWRRTIFVWISVGSFTSSVMVVMLFCRPVVLLGRRRKGVGESNKFNVKKIPW